MQKINTLTDFHRWIGHGPRREAAALQELDLTEQPELEHGDFKGCLFLGCELSRGAAANLVGTGALVIPLHESFPFPLHRATLYTPADLFAGYDGTLEGYAKTFDHEVYVHYLETGGQYPKDIGISLARRLHDHAMTAALYDMLEGQKVVAIMGGHGLERGAPEYGAVARIARTLTLEGYLLTSGGGPGAMEATHLGAWFAHHSEEDLAQAIAQLSVRPQGGRPGQEYGDPDWLQRAWRVRQKWRVDKVKYESIGIPTWLYGHEPPAPFATRIAKYFANSVREEGLLAIAHHGVIFAKGSAGTTQEIFQDATQNHYASFGWYSPMILFGRDYWTTTRPVWPLLQSVARGQVYEELLFLTDDEAAVVRKIRSYDPDIYKGPTPLFLAKKATDQ